MQQHHQTEIARLIKKYKRTITPEELVEEAREADSPLHDMFEWDGTRAAALYWLYQARQVLREYRIVVITHDVGEVRVIHKPPTEIKGVVHDPRADPGEARYRDTTSIKPESRDSFKVVLRDIQHPRTALGNLLELSNYWQLDTTMLRKSIADLDRFIAYLNDNGGESLKAAE